MYADITSTSSIVSVTREEASEDAESYTVVFRILNEVKWKRLIHSILKSSHDSETFGVSIRQEFYLNDLGTPAFVWSMLLWGDLSDAVTVLTPLLAKRGAPPPPPKSLSVSAPSGSSFAARQYKKQGSLVTEVPLPFKRSHTEKTDEAINVREARVSRRPRAFVEGIKS